MRGCKILKSSNGLDFIINLLCLFTKFVKDFPIFNQKIVTSNHHAPFQYISLASCAKLFGQNIWGFSFSKTRFNGAKVVLPFVKIN